MIHAQPVMEIIKQHPAYSSCNYDIYPDSIPDNLTPAPAGKKPFYISHYGRHGSRYISNRTGYDTPYKMMIQAEKVDELTPTGKKVLQEMKRILNDSEDRWGELTYIGSEQERQIARRMMGNGRLGTSSQIRLSRNTYWSGGEAADQATYDTSGTILTTDPAFANPANGDFTPTGAEQLQYKTGDSRWYE